MKPMRVVTNDGTVGYVVYVTDDGEVMIVVEKDHSENKWEKGHLIWAKSKEVTVSKSTLKRLKKEAGV